MKRTLYTNTPEVLRHVRVTIVGAGVIGASWARLFAESGWTVRLCAPRSGPGRHAYLPTGVSEV